MTAPQLVACTFTSRGKNLAENLSDTKPQAPLEYSDKFSALNIAKSFGLWLRQEFQFQLRKRLGGVAGWNRVV